jgi:hypothetical protein
VLRYVTTGRWENDANLVARRDAEKRDLENLSLFRAVSFECLGADALQEFYRQSRNAISREIVFSERVVLPDLPGVEQAYIGVLPVREFMKLVLSNNNEILTSILYDNVRHWQDWNTVNSEMRSTLQDERQQMYFPLLNNGITVVARRVNATGNRMLVEDYQIVNGCQTTFVLHDSADVVTEDVYVPLRLIATTDPDIRDSVIKSTNSQTQISEDQLIALSEFPKKLEAFFLTYPDRSQLYYERRSRQYAAAEGIEKVRIIEMRTMIRSFAAICLDIPHRTTRNYKGLLRSVGTDIFHPDHRLEPYYAAAYAYYRLDWLFRNQVISAELKPARYHLMLAARLIHSNSRLAPLNSYAVTKWATEFCEVLWDDARSRQLFQRAAEEVKEAAEGNLHRDNIRTEPFTESLKRRLESL